MGEFVLWSLICFLDVAWAGVPSHEERDDQVDHPSGGGIFLSLSPPTIKILYLCGVDYIIGRLCSDPVHGNSEYELICSIS